jgi:hypothetical protein
MAVKQKPKKKAAKKVAGKPAKKSAKKAPARSKSPVRKKAVKARSKAVAKKAAPARPKKAVKKAAPPKVKMPVKKAAKKIQPSKVLGRVRAKITEVAGSAMDMIKHQVENAEEKLGAVVKNVTNQDNS